jgi:hypothetical protein
MGFRFRRSIRLLPGLRLNIGKKGGSLSIGGRGATVNLSARGTRTTIGLPGTGLSYSTFSPRKDAVIQPAEAPVPQAEDGPSAPESPGLFGTLFRLVGSFLKLLISCLVLAIQVGILAALVGGIAWVAWRVVSR